MPLSNMNFISHDSRSFSFDERANGYGRGEGLGVIVLKRLTDALANGDTIRAVVRSTASNQDGHTPGITQPSTQAQENLIKETYVKSGLDMSKTRYVEAHGTGTAVCVKRIAPIDQIASILISERLVILLKLGRLEWHFGIIVM